MVEKLTDVRFGLLADILRCGSDVRFTLIAELRLKFYQAK